MDVLEQGAERATLQRLYHAGVLSPEARQGAFRLALPPLAWATWVSRLLLALGGALFLAGVIYYFAYNWDALGKWMRLGIPLAGMSLAAVAARALGAERLAGKVAGMAAAIGVGVFLAVFGQIYQTGADAWELFAGWAGLILPWVLLGRSAPLWMLWLILVNGTSLLYIGQVLRGQPWVEPVTVSLLMGGLNALALGARELGAWKGLEWLKSPWHRETLLVFVLTSLSVPVLELIVNPEGTGGLHVAVLVLLLLVLAGMKWVYTERLRDLFALSLGALCACSLLSTWVGKLLFDGPGGNDAGTFLLFSLLVLAIFGAPVWWLKERWSLERAALAAEPTRSTGPTGATPHTDATSEKSTPEPEHVLPTIGWTLDQLIHRGLLEKSALERARTLLEAERAQAHPPWYLSALMGAGAWLSAAFLVAFLGALDLLDEEIMLLILGIAGVASGMWIRRQEPGLFLEQLALAFTLGGKGMILAWFADEVDMDWGLSLGAVLLWVGTYPFSRDRFDRFVMSAVALVILLGQVGQKAEYPLQVHALLLANLAGLGLVFCVPRPLEALRPAGYALALVFPMTLIFPYYGVMDLEVSEWPIRVALGMALIGLVVWASGSDRVLRERLLRASVVGILLLTLSSTSGVLAGIGLLVMGYACSDRILLVLGFMALSVFGVVYYYMLELTLIAKALALSGTGALMLAGRVWLEAQHTAGAGALGSAARAPGLRVPAGAGVGDRLWQGALVAVIGVFTFLVWQKEETLEHGTLVLLELAPVDPRSLMQGDYMVLRYRALDAFTREEDTEMPRAGLAVFQRDAAGVASYVRQDQGTPLAKDEVRIQYKVRSSARIGAESYFFQEGRADHFARAKYGALRVAPDGRSVLVGLYDESRKPL